MMALWWPSSVSRAIWEISGSDLPMNIWQAVASISLFWPWIFTCEVKRYDGTGKDVSMLLQDGTKALLLLDRVLAGVQKKNDTYAAEHCDRNVMP